MKTKMKKTAAYLLALLLVIQMVPAFADTIYSKSYTQDNVNYRDAIEITPAMDADILKVGMTNQLSVQDGYTKISWASDHPEIATVDSTGLVEAVGPGKVTITVISEGQYKDTISFKVVADTKAEEPKTDPAAQGEESGNNQGEAQAQDEKIIIFIKGNKTKTEYNGQIQKNTYTVTTSNDALFDESKLTMTADHLGQAKDCGVEQDTMSETDFAYDGNAEIVVSNGWIQIKPKAITIKADDKKILVGREEPTFTASVVEDLGSAEAPDLSGITYEIIGDRITPIIDKGTIIGNYKMNSPLSGKLTVVESKPLYNIIKVSGTYYRLKKTQIWTEKDPVKDKNGTLTAADYVVDGYDFSDLTITVGGKEYLYNCEKNAEAIVLGANYYEIKNGATISIVKNKIGAMSNGKPNWLIPEADRYTDKNETDSIHRDFEAVLHEADIKAEVQDIYYMLSVDGSQDYYKLRKGTITAKPYDKVTVTDQRLKKVKESEYILSAYDFTNTVITIDGVDYKYNDGSLDEYENYFTATFDMVVKSERFNSNVKWFNDKASWLDGSYEQYGTLPNNTVGFHANYNATTHKAEERPDTLPDEDTVKEQSVTITSNWPKGKPAFVGTKIVLTANPVGFEGVETNIQWERSVDKENWEIIEGANSLTYEYVLSIENAKYSWRVVVTEKTE